MTTISALKVELWTMCNEYEALMKSIWMLSPKTLSLDNIIRKEKLKNDRKGLWYIEIHDSEKGKLTVSVRASEQ